MRKAKTKAEIERLLGLPWTVELRRNHDGTFFARVVELPGCMTEVLKSTRRFEISARPRNYGW